MCNYIINIFSHYSQRRRKKNKNKDNKVEVILNCGAPDSNFRKIKKNTNNKTQYNIIQKEKFGTPHNGNIIFPIFF